MHNILQLPLPKQSYFAIKIGPVATEQVNALAKNQSIEDMYVHVSGRVWMACREIQIVSEFIHAKLQDALTMYVVL